MLFLQRASAGSGKTYTLTRHYLQHLLAKKTDGNKYKLREPAELEESIRHILAITFTNKATNEMKSRIVTKLYQLSENSSKANPDYLDFFEKELGEPRSKIRHAATIALQALLNNYTDFYVQTIDSFFQSILRTFAYEMDINDTFQVELDNNYIAEVGIDSTLSKISAKVPDKEIAFWAEFLMKRAFESGKKWNLFNKKNKSFVYEKLFKLWYSEMGKEEYKKIAPELKKYFLEYPEFSAIFIELEKKYSDPVKKAFKKVKYEVNRLDDVVKKHNLDPKEDLITYLKSHIVKTLGLDDPFKVQDFKYKNNIQKLSDLKKNPYGAIKNKSYDLHKDAQLIEETTKAALDFYNAVDEWNELLNQEEVKYWSIYRKNLIYLGLMNSISTYAQQVLQSNNLLDISETNTILSRIIGDDDAPFIYERLGNKIENYLIDEFQDTSAMQWDNLKPLIFESEAKNHDSLIIGDAKQSIYKFRNADPNLITTKVPAEVKNVETRGEKKEENSNRRSSQRIVEFNNLFFKELTRFLDANNREYTRKFEDLYFNVVQYPNKQNDHGYVEIRYIDPKDEDMSHVVPLVTELLKKGYKQKDIAFLVTKNDHGKFVINSLIEYNAKLLGNEKPIDFISEQSLLISSASSIKAIISVLEKIVKGQNVKDDTKDENAEKGKKAGLKEVVSNFQFFKAKHPELNTTEALKMFFNQPNEEDAISKMLSGLQFVTLSGLVEAICENFLSEDDRSADAAYIAAFQDAVIDYSNRYPADLGSFLKWWEKQENELSISSPKDSDAVRIMTIHKAKGLEFKCVILPYLAIPLGPIHSEWHWVKPEKIPPISNPLPPYIPIDLQKGDLTGTIYANKYIEYLTEETMDKLNDLYVAFTRPKEQLYIFSPEPKTAKLNTQNLLRTLLPEAPLSKYDYNQKLEESIADPKLFKYDKVNKILSYGKDTGPDTSTETQNEEEDLPKVEDLDIESYTVTPTRPILQYKKKGDRRATNDDDRDPRSEGNILHSIMSMVRTIDDVERAVKKHQVLGFFLSTEVEKAVEFIKKEISRPEISDWFKPGLKIVNERSILRADSEKEKRPDRIVVAPDGTATVIDYKFGFTTDEQYKKVNKEHHEQVRNYMQLLSSMGKYSNVKGYIWYVYRKNGIEEVKV